MATIKKMNVIKGDTLKYEISKSGYETISDEKYMLENLKVNEYLTRQPFKLTIDLKKQTKSDYYYRFRLPFSSGTYRYLENTTFIIDWGDGTTTEITDGNFSDTVITHEYSTRDVYQISMTSEIGYMPYLYFYYYSSGNCPAIISIDTPLMTMISSSYIKSLYTSFSFDSYVPNITSIPADLFRYNSQITSLSDFFYNNTSIKEIPTGLFDYLPNLSSCSYLFYGCSSLETIPDDLFKYNTEITSMSSAFRSCSSLKTLPKDLFRYNTKITSFSYCFYNCTSLETIPDNLFKYNDNVTSFEYCFRGCTSLETIPDDLFKYNDKVTTFIYCFAGCSKLTINPNIFGEDYDRFKDKKCSFNNMFYRESFTGTEAGTAPELWKYDINNEQFFVLMDIGTTGYNTSQMYLTKSYTLTPETILYSYTDYTPVLDKKIISYDVNTNICYVKNENTGTIQNMRLEIGSAVLICNTRNMFNGKVETSLTNYDEIPNRFKGVYELQITPTPSDATVSITKESGENKFSFEVSKPGYLTTSNSITILYDKTLDLSLIPEGMKTYTINPTPADATVVLTADGYTQEGNSITVPNNTHVLVSVSKENYHSYSADVYVVDTATAEIVLTDARPFKFTVDTESCGSNTGNKFITIPFRPYPNYQALRDTTLTIDWGDNSEPTVISAGNVSQAPSHQYENVGVYQITISSTSGMMPEIVGFTNSYGSSTGQSTIFGSLSAVISVDTPFLKFVSPYYSAFNGNFGSCFCDNKNLKSVCSGLFDKNVDAMQQSSSQYLMYCFYSTFRNCTSLETIPDNLFAKFFGESMFGYYQFSTTFYGCNKLKLNPLVFGNITNKTIIMRYPIINLYSTFYRDTFTGTETGTAPELWTTKFVYQPSGASINPSANNCFAGNGNNTESLSNYDSIPDNWKGKTSPNKKCKVEVMVRPEDATVVLEADGYTQEGNSITVLPETVVSGSISKDNYETQTFSETISSSTTKYAYLQKTAATIIALINDDDSQVVLEADGYTQEGNSITVPVNTTVHINVIKNGSSVYSKDYVAIMDNVFKLYNETLTINPTPADATVVLEADGYTQEGNSITVIRGTNVNVTVSKDGYHPQTQTISVDSSKSVSIELEEEIVWGLKTTTDYSTIVLPFATGTYSSLSNETLNIDWGDGTTTEITDGVINSTNMTHTYSTTGEYDISIKSTNNQMPSLKSNSYSGDSSHYFSELKGSLLKIVSTNGSLTKYMDYAFRYYYELHTISEDLFKHNPQITSFYYCFYGDEKLTSIPEGLFRYNTNTTSFQACFFDCEELTSIPEGLFRYNTKAEVFTSCFSGCINLTSVPEGLFRYNTEAEYFAYTFQSCGKIKTIPENLFKYNTKTINVNGTFKGCPIENTTPADAIQRIYPTSATTIGGFNGWVYATNDGVSKDYVNAFYNRTGNLNGAFGGWNITSVPEDLFDDVTEVTDIGNLFRETKLTTVPANIFKKLTNVTNMEYMFYSSALNTIPEDLLRYNTKLENASGMFCSTKVTTIPEDLLRYCPEITNVESLFRSVSGITTIPENLFRYNTKITHIGQANATPPGVFALCSNLTSIPENLFRYCPEIKVANCAFYGCSKLKTVPADLFKYNTKLENCNALFYGCRLLETIPDNLFATNTQVYGWAGAFNGCNKLKLNPNMFGNLDNMFKNLTSTPTVANMFYRDSFTGTEAGTAPEIWNCVFTGTNGQALTPNTSGAFAGNGNNINSITNYNEIPSNYL